MKEPILKRLQINNTVLLFILFITASISMKSYAQCLPHSIFTAANEPILYACAGDGKPDPFFILKTDTSQLKYAFALADNGDNLIRVQNNPDFNLDGTTSTSFRIWGVSYSDSITYMVGKDVSTISAVRGCVRLSENVLIVIRDIPKTLTVLLSNGKADTSLCLNVGSKDTLNFKMEGLSNSKRIYLVTQFGGLILDTFVNHQYILEGVSDKSYFIHAMSYTGTLNIIKNVSKTSDKTLASGCFVVGNIAARVNLDTLDRGTLQSLTAQSLFCPQDSKPDLFSVRIINGESPSTVYVLVNDQSIAQSIYTSENFDLNNNPPGNYSLLALQYSGALLLKKGDTISRSNPAVLTTDCAIWATGEINVSLVTPIAGTVRTSTLDTILFGCPGDRLPDRYTFEVFGQSGNNYVIVVVNAQNKVIAMTTPGGFVDFEQFPAGVAKVYGVSYSGDLLITINSTFGGALSTDCFDITSKQLTVNLDVAIGGTISLADGQTSYYSCPSLSGLRKILFSKKNNSNSPYQFVLTTDGGTILDFVTNDSLSFANTNLSSMRIYGVAYSGNRIINKQSNLFVSSFSDGCYNISENFIRVIQEQPRGGGVRLPDGGNKALFCPSDPDSKILQLRNVDVSLHPYAFILTDSSYKVLVIGQAFTMNFTGLKEGLYRIFGVSYVGPVLLQVGDTLDFTKFSQDCFSFSGNSIEVVIGEINGGVLTSSEESTTAFTCPSNLDIDLIRIIPLNAKSLSYRYIITDLQNIITGFSSVDLIDFGSGVINSSCRVYGVAYKGDFTGMLNKNVLQSSFSTNCYDLSDNFITIKKSVPPPHRIQTSTKDSILNICSKDSVKDTIRFSTSDSVGFKTAILMVDINSKILKVYNNTAIDFNQDSAGFSRLYSVIYTGRLLASPGLSLISGLAISDDCFSLSSNFIQLDIVNSGPLCTITSNKDESWIRKFNLFPNPASDQVAIELNLIQSTRLPAQVMIYDLNGRQMVRDIRNLRMENTFTLPTSELATGIYMVKITSGQFTATRKLIINRE